MYVSYASGRASHAPMEIAPAGPSISSEIIDRLSLKPETR